MLVIIDRRDRHVLQCDVLRVSAPFDEGPHARDTCLSVIAACHSRSEAWRNIIAFFDAFAAGAILTLFADDLPPEAHADANKLVGMATAAGFAVAATLSFSG